jgi:hypothetical protein
MVPREPDLPQPPMRLAAHRRLMPWVGNPIVAGVRPSRVGVDGLPLGAQATAGCVGGTPRRSQRTRRSVPDCEGSVLDTRGGASRSGHPRYSGSTRRHPGDVVPALRARSTTNVNSPTATNHRGRVRISGVAPRAATRPGAARSPRRPDRLVPRRGGRRPHESASRGTKLSATNPVVSGRRCSDGPGDRVGPIEPGGTRP